MKRVLWFDSVGGASGDMILSSLVDLGVRPADLNEPLASLGDFHVSLEAHRHTEHGMHGTRLTVHAHEHSHEQGGHHPHENSHHHRHLSDIRTMVTTAKLPEEVKRRSLAVFERLAQAEASVHGTTPEEVHFHEVGALDSIADIVGSCLALHLLHIDHIGCSPLPQGHGVIECAHGIFPNPPPGTLELLKGFPVSHADEPFELVTPTGAALLSTWRSLDRWPDSWSIKAIGHGFGQRKLNLRPNLLRAIILEEPIVAPADPDLCLVLETNIDDTTPELVGALVPKLLAAGAYDAFTTAIQMKKQRPGTLLTILCTPDLKSVMLDLVFTESTTFGVREHLTRRTMLEREMIQVRTAYGPIGIKIGRWHGTSVTASPEYEDCLKAAKQHGVPVRLVYECAQTEARTKLG